MMLFLQCIVDMIKILNRKNKRAIRLYVFALVWLTVVLYWYRDYYYFSSPLIAEGDEESLHSIYDVHDDHFKLPTPVEFFNNGEPKDFKEDPTYKMLYHAYGIIEKQGMKERPASVYTQIFQNHDMVSVLGHLNFRQRCELFFKNLFLIDQNWALDPGRKYELGFGKPYEEFIAQNLEKFKAQYEKEKLERSQKSGLTVIIHFKDYIMDQFNKEKMLRFEQDTINDLSILRLYNKCYVTNDDEAQKKNVSEFIAKQQKFMARGERKTKDSTFRLTKSEKLITSGAFSSSSTTSNFDHRIYPWLSLELPIFERWTGEVYTSIPVYRDILKDKTQPPPTASTTSSSKTTNTNFFKTYKSLCNGKGIVLTIGDHHGETAANLIRLLRALNNRLPIQILYHDGLRTDTKEKLVAAARDNFLDLPRSYSKVSDLLPRDPLRRKTKYQGFPKQELWFVNMGQTIHSNHKNKFLGFANKLLATLFNSFNEFILVDADTVLLQNPEIFFQLQGYKNTGTFFFQDRGTSKSRSLLDGKIFHYLSQSGIDKIMFDINNFSNHTLQQKLFRGAVHSMESGLVVINRQRHFSSLLLIVHLNFVDLITGKIHGEKELFWLGFAFNGDENYHFNQLDAAAVGELTSPLVRKKPNGDHYHSQQLCSAHPGHISEEDGRSLLWINSGFKYCHNYESVDYPKELEISQQLPFVEKTVLSFKRLYSSPLRIQHAIIPPVDDELTWRQNDAGEPASGWIMTKYCRGYLWCAHLSIGGKIEPDKDNTMEGKLITFSDQERSLFDFYGDIWLGLE